MVFPALSRVVAGTLGGTIAAGGYAVGKAGEVIGAGKAVDSAAFHAGITSFLWSNGIFPTVTYEPSRDASLLIAAGYGSSPQADSDITQTPLLVANHICYLDGPV